MNGILFILFVIVLIMIHCAYNSIAMYKEINPYNSIDNYIDRKAMEFSIASTLSQNGASYNILLIVSLILTVIFLW